MLIKAMIEAMIKAMVKIIIRAMIKSMTRIIIMIKATIEEGMIKTTILVDRLVTARTVLLLAVGMTRILLPDENHNKTSKTMIPTMAILVVDRRRLEYTMLPVLLPDNLKTFKIMIHISMIIDLDLRRCLVHTMLLLLLVLLGRLAGTTRILLSQHHRLSLKTIPVRKIPFLLADQHRQPPPADTKPNR
jgi:hypothetical protein